MLCLTTAPFMILLKYLLEWNKKVNKNILMKKIPRISNHVNEDVSSYANIILEKNYAMK